MEEELPDHSNDASSEDVLANCGSPSINIDSLNRFQ